jgi:exopolyphosphatase/guanosine-5'-triphosphate,3'-diphosphate pyrophosphatase
MLEAKTGASLLGTASKIPVDMLRALLEETAPLSLAERRQIAGLSAARADVFPTALVTVLTIADIGGFSFFLHSSHNLRYGLAAELLED